MDKSNFNHSSDSAPAQTHIHYHYHYHYPLEHPHLHPHNMQQEYEVPIQPRSQRIKTQHLSPRTQSSQFHQWKRQINPEVTRIYDQFNSNNKNSRFSQVAPQISEEDHQTETMSPRRSEVIHSANYSSAQLDGPKNPSKLEQLYFQQQSQRNKNFELNNTKVSQITGTSEMDLQLKLRDQEKQIERLRRMQEECSYLRDKFYSHADRRHPDELRK